MSKKCDCGAEAIGWRTTRWGTDAVCAKCAADYPADASFVPFNPMGSWEPQNSVDSKAGEHVSQ